MRTFLAMLLVVVVITAIGLFGADNSVGTWKLNIEKSKYTPAPLPYKSLTMTREAVDGGVKATRTGVLADGSPLNSTYTAQFDGKEHPANGGPWGIVSIQQVDANTFTAETRKAGGKYHTISRTTVSSDGKTLTTVAKGVDAEGKAIRSTLVYDRQ
jgi:hypothetical protein